MTAVQAPVRVENTSGRVGSQLVAGDWWLVAGKKGKAGEKRRQSELTSH